MPLIFRARGAAIQVVRSTPDAATGRAATTGLGQIPTDGARVPDALVAKLTPAEKAEVDAYVANLQSLETMRTEVAIRSLNLTAASAVKAMTEAKDEATKAAYLAILKDTFQTVRSAVNAVEKPAKKG